jgi:hypothetical protein
MLALTAGKIILDYGATRYLLIEVLSLLDVHRGGEYLRSSINGLGCPFVWTSQFQ